MGETVEGGAGFDAASGHPWIFLFEVRFVKYEGVDLLLFGRKGERGVAEASFLVDGTWALFGWGGFLTV
jgi:hypothetical protein